MKHGVSVFKNTFYEHKFSIFIVSEEVIMDAESSVITSSSAMAERPRKLDQRFQMRGSI